MNWQDQVLHAAIVDHSDLENALALAQTQLQKSALFPSLGGMYSLLWKAL